ncbi:hypothetical protein GCM10010964_41900 [Caldovatus sediminis]|uniref:Uncharacterized protein n=1 Tax=Caldovatus sediminis TaxID=2041189 RepID=A0A8J3EE79_9PROT|nr:hypothetical protein [Caldovatus sediminis]GGG50222.1 hypothetical protein GCM10010964_41900 [Caldovatus sediminis]
MRHPAGFAWFAWQSGWVFALRGARLWARPAEAAASLTAMAIEKQRAAAEGWVAASRAALRGADAGAVAAARGAALLDAAADAPGTALRAFLAEAA